MTHQLTEWNRVPVFGVPPADGRRTIRPSAYAVIANQDDMVAVVKTPRGIFLPGGGIDRGESVEAAIIREVREECGLVVTVGVWNTRAIEHLYSAEEETQFEKRSTFHVAMICGAPVDPIEPDHELIWLPSAAALSALSPPSHSFAIAEWVRARATSVPGDRLDW
ncbi:MAG: NUDIX domain-containing protein [bacterium]